MASAVAATDSALDKSHVEDVDEARKVHEITESSSDESGDEQAAIEDEQDEEKAAEMPAPDVVEKMRAGVYMPDPEEFYNTKNVADMHYLFTNDKLKEESPALVLRSDPFCIPRVTDNVPNYRPMLNPLSIFLGEDKLLPGNFRLDPSEQLPSAEEQDAKKAPRRLLPPPGGSTASTSSGKQFRGKTSAFMGTLPRQTEFAEIPVSEKLFQNHEVFRPSQPVPRVPVSPRPPPAVSNAASNRVFAAATSEAEASTTSSPAATTSSPAATAGTTASYSDAMLLSSIQHTLDVTTAALSSTMPSRESGASDAAPPTSEAAPASSGYQIQQLHPLESVAHTLSNYLPSRDGSRPMDGSYYNAPGGYNAVNVPMGYTAPGHPGTFGSLLSPGNQTGGPYAGLFESNGEAQHASQNMQTFSSALGSISITTPTGAAGIHSGLITPQGGVARPSDVAPRRPAKKPRAKNVFRPCTFSGCTKGARGKSGLCQKHGGGKRCAAPNCPKGAQGSSSMCLFHGGGYRCTVEGCSTGARGTSGLCAKHGGYKKGKRGPDVNGPASKRVRTDEPQPAARAE